MRKRANIPRYVKLSSEDHIGIKDGRLWFRTVRDYGPPGAMTSIDSINKHGEIESTRMIRRSKGNVTEMIIPLVRDLLPNEVQAISDAWRRVAPPGKFSISINPTQDQKLSQAVADMKIEHDEYQALCAQLAKVQHEGWMREKASEGWHYGPVLSLQNKTHPLMLPWSELPEKYKDIKSDNPENFLRFLNNQGFAVVKQSELGSLLKILRDIS